MLKPPDSSIEQNNRARDFGAFLDKLSAPTPAQLWLERAAAQLEAERRQSGNLKGGEK